MLTDMPKCMYKYRGLEDAGSVKRLERMIVRGEIYFASPTIFNDPLDLAIQPSFEATNLQLEAYWTDDLKSRRPTLSKVEIKRRVKKFVLSSKTETGRQQIARVHLESIQRAGVLCLCANATSTLMWSYYGNGHTGVAVRFRLNEAALPALTPLILWRVRYRSDFPLVNYYLSDSMDYFEATLATKSLEWAHEKEWRFSRPGRVGVAVLPLDVIDGVIFGLRTPAALRRTIRGWASQRSAPIEFLEVVNKPRSFELEVQPCS